MPDLLTAALDQIRNRATNVNYQIATEGCYTEQAAFDSQADVPRLLAAVDAVLVMHQPFRIYDECDHGHSEEDIAEGRAVDTGEFVACHEVYMYSICTECCRDAQGFETEECADSHFHDITHCKTALAISRALTGGDGDSG